MTECVTVRLTVGKVNKNRKRACGDTVIIHWYVRGLPSTRNDSEIRDNVLDVKSNKGSAKGSVDMLHPVTNTPSSVMHPVLSIKMGTNCSLYSTRHASIDYGVVHKSDYI